MSNEKARTSAASVNDSSLADGDSEVDTAWIFLNDRRNVEQSTDIAAIRRKVDWNIVPLMFCCFTMQFLDKVILNVSRGLTCLPFFKFSKLGSLAQVCRSHGTSEGPQSARK